MNDEEEMQQYGQVSSKMAQATLSAAQIIKDKQKEEQLRAK